MNARTTALALAWLAAGCGSSTPSAPWLTMPDATSHQAHFPIAPGEAHGPAAGQATADCNGCHYDKAAAAPSATFKVFTCTRCHVLLRSGLYHDDPQATFSTWHVAAGVSSFDSNVAAANMVGVAQFDAACYGCHPSGIAVDHATRFLLPHQDAAGTIVAACADCHVDPTNRQVLGCASCHPHDQAATATGHLLVPDFSATDSARCARCHEDGKIPVAVTAHAAGAQGFVVGAGSHAGAAGGACLLCHDQGKAAPRAFVANFAATTCVGCHDVVVGGNALHGDPVSLAPLHASEPAFTNTLTMTPAQFSAACLACHTDGAGGAPANHEQLFPRAAGTAHAGISCSQCHTNPANRADLTAFACASCHAGLAGPPTLAAAHAITGYGITTYLTAATAGGTTTTVQVDMTDSRTCLRCHADSQVDRVAAHTTSNSGFGTGRHRPAGCLTCHSRMRSDKAWGADFGEAKGSAGPPPTGCYVCHQSGTGN